MKDLSKHRIMGILGKYSFAELQMVERCLTPVENDFYKCDEEAILEYAQRRKPRKEAVPFYLLCYVLDVHEPSVYETLFKDALFRGEYDVARKYLFEWVTFVNPNLSMVLLFYLYLMSTIYPDYFVDYEGLISEFVSRQVQFNKENPGHSIFLRLTETKNIDGEKVSIDNKERLGLNVIVYERLAEEYALMGKFKVALHYINAAIYYKNSAAPVTARIAKLFPIERLLDRCSDNSQDDENEYLQVIIDLIQSKRWDELFVLFNNVNLYLTLKIKFDNPLEMFFAVKNCTGYLIALRNNRAQTPPYNPSDLEGMSCDALSMACNHEYLKAYWQLVHNGYDSKDKQSYILYLLLKEIARYNYGDIVDEDVKTFY